MRVKVHIVQWADGVVPAAKLHHADARAIAREHAPSRVLLLVADKSPVSPSDAARGGSNGGYRHRAVRDV